MHWNELVTRLFGTGHGLVAEGDFIRGDVAMVNGHPTLMQLAREGGIDFGMAPLPGKDGGPGLACAVIVKRVDERTRSKTSINELLRD